MLNELELKKKEKGALSEKQLERKEWRMKDRRNKKKDTREMGLWQ